MNAVVNETDRMNRRMDSPNIQRKLLEISREYDESDGKNLRTPQQRRIRRARSNANASSRGNRRAVSPKENTAINNNEVQEMSPFQRKLQRNANSGNCGNGGSSARTTTAQNVIELLELLQSSPYAIPKNETTPITVTPPTSKDRTRNPPLRTYSEELYTPSRRNKRTGLRVPLRMMPKEKPASMGDLFRENGKSNRRGSRKKNLDSSQSPKEYLGKARKGENRLRSDRNMSDSSPTSPRSGLNHDRQQARCNLDDCEVKNIRDFINIESSPSKCGKLEGQTDLSYDSSFFQEAPSTLGDFHRKQRPSKDKNSPKGGKRRPLPDRRSPTNGLILHSSSTMYEIHKEEEDKARRRRTRCSAGGKVRNHRTQEEYTGFFLTSPTEDNIKHGYGITKFPDGRLFEGVYERGMMMEGKMTYPALPGTSAPTYVGKFDQDGLRCGKGIYTTETTTFLGQFRRDLEHGSGILIYHYGSEGAETSQSRRFIGHWKDGLKHGYGREILASGTIEQEGLWEAGQFLGNETSSGRRA